MSQVFRTLFIAVFATIMSVFAVVGLTYSLVGVVVMIAFGIETIVNRIKERV